MLLEESQIVGQQCIVERVVAEVQNALHRTSRSMLYHPLQVLGLQVGYTHVLHHALFAKLHQCGQCLVYYQLQSALHIALKLYVVYVYQVDVVHVQSLHTLVHALLSALGAVVPGVNAVVSVSAHLGRQIVFLMWYVLKRLAQHGLGLKVSIVGRHVDEVDTIVNCRVYSLYSLFFADAVEHSAQR